MTKNNLFIYIMFDVINRQTNKINTKNTYVEVYDKDLEIITDMFNEIITYKIKVSYDEIIEEADLLSYNLNNIIVIESSYKNKKDIQISHGLHHLYIKLNRKIENISQLDNNELIFNKTTKKKCNGLEVI
jgi:hypothetical protein